MTSCRGVWPTTWPWCPTPRSGVASSPAASARIARSHPDDARAANPRFTPQALQANQAIVDAVRAVAGRLGATVAQVSLAWVLAQGDGVIPIPGPDRIDQLEEDLGAATVMLDAEALAALDALPTALDANED